MPVRKIHRPRTRIRPSEALIERRFSRLSLTVRQCGEALAGSPGQKWPRRRLTSEQSTGRRGRRRDRLVTVQVELVPLS